MSRWRSVALVVAVLLGGLLVRPAPAQAAPESGSSDWRQVSAGGRHTCGIRTDRNVYCWGRDEFGELGDGGTNTDIPVPAAVTGSSDWRQVSAGFSHTCAVKITGRLYCWGSDFYGELGDGGTNTAQTVPTEVAGGAANWASVSAGGSVTCARKTNGRLFCWGFDDYGALGDGGAFAAMPIPTQVAGGATDWASVSAGSQHTCARKTTGRLYCWGDDGFGELGDGPGNSTSGSPVQVAGGATNWTSVSVGQIHTCARRTTGRLFCWGDDDGGQLGNGSTTTDQFVPVPVAGGATDWGVVTTGESHTCARKTNGHLYCWGFDSLGQLGDGGTNSSQPIPAEVFGQANDWSAVDAGQYHTCARIRSGRLFCWGFDDSGQLGNEAGGSSGRPVPVWA